MFIGGDAMDIGVAVSDAETAILSRLRCILGYACALPSVP